MRCCGAGWQNRRTMPIHFVPLTKALCIGCLLATVSNRNSSDSMCFAAGLLRPVSAPAFQHKVRSFPDWTWSNLSPMLLLTLKHYCLNPWILKTYLSSVTKTLWYQLSGNIFEYCGDSRCTLPIHSQENELYNIHKRYLFMETHAVAADVWFVHESRNLRWYGIDVKYSMFLFDLWALEMGYEENQMPHTITQRTWGA